METFCFDDVVFGTAHIYEGCEIAAPYENSINETVLFTVMML
jgi:hypothetical protein